MAKQLKTSAGTGAKWIWIVMALVVAAVAVPAISGALSIEVTGDVYSDKCDPCHANVDRVDGHPKYIFTHGNHITYQCSACHPQFPHRPEGTDTPVMKECWNCHGLQHGPQGVLASGKCVDCHGDKLVDLRPASHTFDWAKKPHVIPANERLTTECSMCHSKSDCDKCHVAENVAWAMPEPMIYDAGNGCMACHGSPNLIKNSAAGIVSYQVTGIESSAHRELTCGQCHTDFAYAKTNNPSNVWYINAGLSCAGAGCHDEDDPTTPANENAATAWKFSVHGAAITAGDLKSATCGSCHGGHDIALLDTESAKLDLHLAGEEMCADCHQDYWDNYNDAYHGAAYKRKAADAPACWDCHPAHAMLTSDDPKSTTNAANLATTCSGPEGCHLQHVKTSETFVKNTSAIIHQQESVRDENLATKLLRLLPGGK